jgi:hypothetical protein
MVDFKFLDVRRRRMLDVADEALMNWWNDGWSCEWRQ